MSAEGDDRPLTLRELALRPAYDTGDDALHEFYVPALSCAVAYDRSVGYFRSSSLSVAAKGVSRFVRGGGRMRLLVGAEIAPEDRDALRGVAEIPAGLAERLASELVPDDEIARRRLEVLAWLVKEGRLTVKVAVAVDEQGAPIVGGDSDPYFHLKVGVLRDAAGNAVAFQGSTNESRQGWARNFEAISVFTSWEDGRHFDEWARRFDEYWAGQVEGFRVYDLPEAVRERLVRSAPPEPPPERDVEERDMPASRGAIARFLRVAPRLVGAQALAEATSAVTLQPHQRQVVARLADEYPRSWLVADEVGLGKTISAGMALRRLLLSGQVRRALILAPANVCRQWQDELFEKFGLWVPRVDGGKVYGAHPDDVRWLEPGENPFAAAPVVIASSHLARRREYQDRVLAAGPFDLLVVDEAHHARRKREEEGRYRPGRLLELLDRVTDEAAAAAIWLLTATPMQVDPVELRDLLRHTGLAGRLADEETFVEYYAQLRKAESGETPDWGWLQRALAETPAPPAGAGERAVLERIERKLGPVGRARIEQFASPSENPEEVAVALGASGRRELVAWLRHRGPVGQFVTRHSRETLKRYRREGLLEEPMADRDVQPVLIELTREEQELYDDLDQLVDRLLEAHGRRRGAGLVLTVYRRRLTSSWQAIRRTLQRRLDREALLLDEGDLEEEAEEAGLDTGDGRRIDDAEAVPLSDDDLAAIRRFCERIDALRVDSKMDVLESHIDEARARGESLVVFTQFTDTLEAIRDRLRPVYGPELATFTGDGGREWRDERWAEISKRDLVEAIRARRVRVLVANDAASEGLNLQACSRLVNFDMPWNPMRVEQRIGRIDRLGQAEPVVTVRNYFIPNTVEQRVYEVLAGRIDDFVELLGNLQPILGATEEAFRSIFLAPRSERERVEREELERLVGKIDELRAGGVELEDEDPLPIPAYGEPPVSLRDLREYARDALGLELAQAERPVTWERERASRDPTTWAALATYGHPLLEEALKLAEREISPATSGLVVVDDPTGVAAAVRADRTPPRPVATVAELDELGEGAAVGEAEALAREAIQQEVARRQAQRRAVEAMREARRELVLRRRFVELVHEMIRSECARARLDGRERLPAISAWHDLRDDLSSGWQYAETFRLNLGLELRELLPEVGDGGRPTLTRADGYERLRELMHEWRESAGGGR